MAEAESLQVNCPNCLHEFRVKRFLAGTRVRCPNQDCGFAIAVAEPNSQLETAPDFRSLQDFGSLPPVAQQKTTIDSWLEQPLPSAERTPPVKRKTAIKPVPAGQYRAADFTNLYRRFLIAYIAVMSTQVIAFLPQTATIRTVEWAALLPRMGVVILLSSIFLYGAWAQIQDGEARTTPAKAVGYRFIPVYNFYWEFVAVKGLAEDMGEYARARNIGGEPVPKGLALAYCILTMMPPVVALIVGVCLASNPNLAIGSASILGLVLGIPVAVVLLVLFKKIAAASAAIAEAKLTKEPTDAAAGRA